MSMDEAKRKTFRHVVKGWAILLCVLFFVCPLIKCAEIGSVTATGWEISTGTGTLFNESKSESGYPLAFVLVIIPAAVFVLAFTNKSFIVLRNTSIIGLVAKCVFLIIVYAKLSSGDLKGALVLTEGNWFIVFLYAGLIGFTHWCVKQERVAPSSGVSRIEDETS